jgi:RNA-binding protein YhbY
LSLLHPQGEPGSTAPHEKQQPAAAAAADTTTAASSNSSSSSSPWSFTEEELRQLWDSVSRSLLKLGKSGLSDTHTNSLRELLAAHKLVKVQLNAAHSDDVAAAAAADLEQRLQGAGAVMQVGGCCRTALRRLCDCCCCC